MNLFVELNELMVKYRFRPNRKMAQLFIIDENVIRKMVEAAELSPDDSVLEIGAGTGFLTRELQKKCRVIAIELDDVLFELLESELPKKNLELMHGNFLELEVGKFNKVVALPPYTISSDIMSKLFELKPELCILVFQREFVERLLALPGFAEYNALSVLAQYYFRTERLGSIPAVSFFPRPNSDSVMVKLTFSQQYGKAKDEHAFQPFVKSLFRFQNKNLLNALENSLPFLKEYFKGREKVLKKIESHPLSKEKVNLLSCEEFVEVFNTLLKK